LNTTKYCNEIRTVCGLDPPL